VHDPFETGATSFATAARFVLLPLVQNQPLRAPSSSHVALLCYS